MIDIDGFQLKVMAPQIDQHGLDRGGIMGSQRFLDPRIRGQAAKGEASCGLPENGAGKGSAGERNNEGDQMLGAIRQTAGNNGYVGQRKVPPQHGFHVLGLYPVAVHLELVIHAAEKMQQARFVAPREVTGAVKPFAGSSAKGSSTNFCCVSSGALR